MLHLPPDIAWDSRLVHQCIESRGVSGTVRGDDVFVIVPNTPGDSLISRLVRWFRPLSVTVSVDHRRFIRNVDLSFDILRMPLEDGFLTHIRLGLRDFGCIADDDRRIAERYMPNSKALSDLFDEIERIQHEKESLVAEQDFEGAVRKRDAENLLRNRVDDILRAHIDTPCGE